MIEVAGFLHNDYRLQKPVVLNGIPFPTVTHAFEASKTKDTGARKRIAQASNPALARIISGMSQAKSGWRDVQVNIMAHIIEQKFARNRQLLNKLLETSDDIVFVDHDLFWGAIQNEDQWIGQNQLGKILMELRSKYSQSNCNSC